MSAQGGGKPGGATLPRCALAAPLAKIRSPGNPQRRPRKKTTILILNVADHTKAFPFLLGPTGLMRPRGAVAKRESLTMPEHLIRLRGGWLRLAADAPPDHPMATTSARVTLPITWPEEAGCGVGSAWSGRLDHRRSTPRTSASPFAWPTSAGSSRPSSTAGRSRARRRERPPSRYLCRYRSPRATCWSSTWSSPVAGNRPESLTRPWGTIALVIGPREAPPDGSPASVSRRIRGRLPRQRQRLAWRNGALSIK